MAEDPSLVNSEDGRHELVRRYDLARRDAGTATLSRCMRVLKDQRLGLPSLKTGYIYCMYNVYI